MNKVSKIIILLIATIPCIFAKQIVEDVTSNTLSVVFSENIPVGIRKDITFALVLPRNIKEEVIIQSHSQSVKIIQNVKKISEGYKSTKFMRWYSVKLMRTKLDCNNDLVRIKIKLPVNFKKDIFHNGDYIGNIIDFNFSRVHKRELVSIPQLQYTYGLRILVDEDGVYSLTGRELKNCGVPIDRINASHFKLFNKNIEIPIALEKVPTNNIMNDNSELLFYGKYLRDTLHHFTQYSYENVYWLVWNINTPSLRVTELTGKTNYDPDDFSNKNSAVAGNFLDTLHIEVDTDIRWLGSIAQISETDKIETPDDTTDNWYWGFIGDDELTNFTINVPSPQNSLDSTFSLSIALAGLSSVNSISNEHNYSIHINNNPTGITATWDGQNSIVVSSDKIPLNFLKAGNNTITFKKLTNDTIADRAILNWMDIAYKRELKATDNFISFTQNGSYINKNVRFNITGFTKNDIDIWDVENMRRFTNITKTNANDSLIISFEDSITLPSRYVAYSISQRKKPKGYILDTVQTDWSFPKGCNYIILTTDFMMEATDPLKKYYTEKGITVVQIDIQDVYNSFAYGIHNPESIKNMLKYIYNTHISSPPKFLLLGGDASHDMDKKNQYRNRIPTHLSHIPNWGPAADDGYFATLYGTDRYPDISVGRFPANDSVEMRIMVNKTVNYLRNPDFGYWRDNILLASGFDKEFTTFNTEAVNKIVGTEMNSYRMDANPGSKYYVDGAIASNKIIDYINSGLFAINFAGHGGGNVWSDSRFFSYTDLPKLQNGNWGKGGKLPAVFSFTCLSGFFESYFYKSLGEEFLRYENGGAITFYGASGYTRRAIDIDMSKIMLKNEMSREFKTIGELVSQTETEMLAKYSSEAIPLVNEYNLLGDPALVWQITKKSFKPAVSIKRGPTKDTVKVETYNMPIESGNYRITFTPDNPENRMKYSGTFSNASIIHNFAIKKNLSFNKGQVRLFISDDITSALGSAEISKDAFSISNVILSEITPKVNDSVSVFCTIESDTVSIGPVQVLFAFVNPDVEDVVFADTNALFMKEIDTLGNWESSEKIFVNPASIGTDPYKKLVLEFRAINQPGESGQFTFPISGLCDLTIPSINKPVWNNDTFECEAEILNKGNTKADSAYLIVSNNADTISKFSISSLNSGDTRVLKIPLPYIENYNTLNFNVITNSTESNTTNNSATVSFNVTAKLLSSISDTLKSDSGGVKIIAPSISTPQKVYLQSENVDTSINLLSTLSNPLFITNEGYKYYTFYTTNIYKDSVFSLSISYDTSTVIDTSQKVLLFTKRNGNRWSVDSSTHSKGVMTAQISSGTTFTIGTSSDKTAPSIRAFVSGRELLYLDYVAKDQPFNIILSDSSGIDTSTVEISNLAGNITKDKISSSYENDNKNSITMTLYPQTSFSVDTLSVRASDLAGNFTTKKFAYRPGKELAIRFFSSHPNPFKAKTGKFVRFAYLLTDMAESVKLDIYTISGRKVWHWENSSPLIGYQEIKWDGTTQNSRSSSKGYRIANGTYYAKLTVKNSGKEVKKIIRIAKLEGF